MLGWFAETTLVASGLAVVAALAGRLRSIGPTARHALWLVVLVKLMTPPVVCWPWPAPWGDLDWPLITFSPQALGAGLRAPEGSPPDAGPGRLKPPYPVFRSDGAGQSPWSPAPLPERADVRRLCLEPSRTGPCLAPAVECSAAIMAIPVAPDAPSSGPKPDDLPWWLPRGLVSSWLAVTVLLGAVQASRIIRFRRRLRLAVPAPDDLVEEAEWIGERLGVRVPELLVVPDLGTPLLWCLGRPKLLLPVQLVKTFDLDRWRGILIHELAHLRRGDHWVSRLELAASLLWWWNPLYWLTRARLDAEAELACDAWVVWALPKHRLAYAEALFDICSTLSLAGSPAPALGATGSGRFFERRLTMILHEHVPCRLSPLAFLGACLLVLFALPSWSAARPVVDEPTGKLATAFLAPTVDQLSTVSIVDDDDDADDDDDDADDDDDDDPASRAKAKAKAEAKQAQAEARKARAEARAVQAEARARAKAKAKAKEHKGDVEDDGDASRIRKEIEGKFGPGSDFEKKMEEFGEKIGKEMEAKFGPGSDFEKKMKTLGKEMEAKFGPGSDFEKKMKTLGKEMESKFGPGSEFEKQMKDLGKEMELKFGPDSEFVKKLKEKSGAGSKDDKEAPKPKAARTAPARPGARRSQDQAPATSGARNRTRERRIAALEDQIRKLADELKALKAEDDRSDN